MTVRPLPHLLRKDWHLVGFPVTAYAVAGCAAVILLGLQNQAAFYAGTVLLITVLVTLGVHPATTTVVGERKDQTIAFTMSLPISAADYLRSKLAFNLLVFFVPWGALLLATCALFAWQDALPDGMIPLVLILFGALAMNAVLILSAALLTESMEKTIATMAVCNLAFHGVLFGAANLSAIGPTLHAPHPVWSPAVFAFLGAYALVIAASLALVTWQHSRKTDFL